jgi:mono/diheme cytochrome c family protein
MKKIFIFSAIVLVAGLVAYEALIFYDNNFRYGRMHETPALRPQEEPMPIMEAGVVPINGGDPILRVTTAEDLIPPVDLKAVASVARGRTVYFTFCAQCHGIDFDGNGTVGQSFSPLPADLRAPAVQSQPAGKLFKSISYGIPGGRQPALDTTIMIEDRWKVIAFVKSLGPRN